MAGAVYTPVAEIVPTFGLNDQATTELEVPPTVAVNRWVWEAVRVVESGVSEMLTSGVSITIALADFVRSATLVAFTVTV